MKALVLVFACLCLFAKSSEALSCYCPEDGSACQQRKLTEVECPFGIILDHCECCRVCAKGPGEECGGPWDISGRCAKGFMCVPKPGDEEKYHFKGKCQKTVPTRPVGGAVDSGLDAEML
ncbi:venom protein 302-like [Macrobrachium nipponense]|uniref:venom protein 302-like n=1 Tax=Macrobrachium nipponense TaxID=159736 RepID=UPI0030C818E5